MSTHSVGESGSAHPLLDINPKQPSDHQLAAHPGHGLHGDVALWEETKIADPFTYQFGYGNNFQSEAVPNALPKLGNTPLKANYGLYAEQLSGTSFTTPRTHNQKVWLYKIRPSAAHTPFTPYNNVPLLIGEFNDETSVVNPNQLRWKPFGLVEKNEKAVDFVDGLATVGGSGDASTKNGFAIHIYSCNTNMGNRSFCNSDGDLLIVPQLTPLLIRTELGRLRVAPGEFCVIPRGIKFSVDLDFDHDYLRNAGDIEAARGYICEVFTSHFVIPDLGPIGANGLANPRHFCAPTAYYENIEADDANSFTLIQKFSGKLFVTTLKSSPFDVVAWHGNYVPVKYDLSSYNTVNSVSYDHLDPSIFTVLTAPTNTPGVAALDFVVFPPRFAVQEDTFRPPYYHRNCMTEFMGNIMGKYDAKPEGFVPGSASLHSCMIGHGPDSNTYQTFSNKEVAPSGPMRMSKHDLAFMFESTYVMKLTKWANQPEIQQTDYYRCWQGLENDFTKEVPK